MLYCWRSGWSPKTFPANFPGLLILVLTMLTAGCAGDGSAPTVEVALIATSTARATSTSQTVPAEPVTTEPLTTVSVSTVLATTAVPMRQPIVLGFAGDTSFTAGLDQRDPFAEVTHLLRAPDLMVVNLETAIADSGVGRPPVQKQFLFRSPPASLDLLVAAGVDVVALANNHTLDFGSEAVAQTLTEIDARELQRVGAGVDEAAAYQPLILDVGEWRVGMVSMSRVPCDWSASGNNVRPEVAWACPAFQELADDLVRRTVSQSDVTVVMVHGGEEGVLCPSDFMLDLEQRWVELGADIIVDGHAHVLQGVGSLGDRSLVVHSTGNFAFPSARGITANTAIFEFTVSERTREPASEEPASEEPEVLAIDLELRVVPLRAAGGVLSIPTEEQRIAILQQVSGVSDGWRLARDGRAIRDPDSPWSC